ncbi:MAG: 5-carboxymethyl-2-hydroxymuconate Delta-isomerase [Candidatus Thorarchaeota archaeon]
MPQILLEYSANIKETIGFENLFADIHNVMSNTGGARKENCKSRLLRHSNYYIGDGKPQNAFVHLEVQWLEGRTIEVVSTLGEELLALLKKYYQGVIENYNLQITVHIKDIHRRHYFKHPKGTFTELFKRKPRSFSVGKNAVPR